MKERPLIQLIEEALDSDELELPVFSKTVLELQELMKEDNYGLSDVARIIEKDQALTSQTLKAANTAYYTGLQPAKTIKDAAVRLGAKSVISMVTLTSQKQLYHSQVKEFNQMMRALWNHALGTATAARWLSINLGFQHVAEESLIAGLLHDIGKLILLKAIESLLLSETISKETSLVLIYDIIDTFHTDHGERFMKILNMPETYCQVASRHHDPEVNAENIILNIVRLSNLTCHKLGIGPKHSPELMLSTTPESINLMAKDLLLAELQVELEEKLGSLDKSL
ncbi:MAG: HDOD domain-containing protein [Deltaproteobacteria bacterium]|nr:HDOD domain-containing protein [Deltaproteobacteria bacterium]MBW2087170.1 HDOD domain-containing protein [Deltaproteobacteria bacterium]